MKGSVFMFITMAIVGTTLNPMNALVNHRDHLYLSLTSVYSGLFMAAVMMWTSELMGSRDAKRLTIGILLSILFTVMMRKQTFVSETQWIRRMIGHHSTALTTSHQILKHTKDPRIKQLAEDIIQTQEREIALMKSMLQSI